MRRDRPIHDDNDRDDPCPTGREWRVRTPVLEQLEATLNALEHAGYRAVEPVRLEDVGAPAFLVLALYDPGIEISDDDEEDEAPEEGPGDGRVFSPVCVTPERPEGEGPRP